MMSDSKYCPLCYDREINSHYAYEMMFGDRTRFEYIECNGCGALSLVDIPEDLGIYYRDGYYSMQSHDSNSIKNVIIWLWEYTHLLNIQLFGSVLSRPLDFLRPPPALVRWRVFKNYRKDASICDVGCGGSAIILKKLESLGYKNLTGLDPYISKQHIVGNNIQLKNISIEHDEGKYDLIMFHHSFEHVLNPKLVLDHAFQRLNDGGSIIIRIPVSSSDAWRKYKASWVQLDAPRHITIHSLESLRNVAEQTNLLIEDYLFESTAFQFWGSEQIKKNIALLEKESYLIDRKSGLFSRDDMKRYTEMAKNANKAQSGDQVCFFLKKRLDRKHSF